MANSALEAILQQLRQLFESEFARGEKGAIDRIVQAAHADAQHLTNGHDAKKPLTRRGSKKTVRGRAPSGAAPALVDRVLAENGQTGATALEIQKAAKTSVEKQVSYSGIRFVLSQGRDKGHYANKDGRWFARARNRTAEQANA